MVNALPMMSYVALWVHWNLHFGARDMKIFWFELSPLALNESDSIGGCSKDLNRGGAGVAITPGMVGGNRGKFLHLNRILSVCPQRGGPSMGPELPGFLQAVKTLTQLNVVAIRTNRLH